MTTKVRRDFVEDIGQPNDVLEIGIPTALPLSAEVWTFPSEGNVPHARQAGLRHCLDRFAEQNSNYTSWLLAAHKSVQPDSRIVRYNRLWSSLRKRGLTVPEGAATDEGMREKDGGLRFFGAIQFDLDQVAAVDAIMFAEAAVIILSDSSGDHLISGLAAAGWNIGEKRPPMEIVDTVCPVGGVVVDVYGEFDDPEVAVVSIGKRDVIPPA